MRRLHDQPAFRFGLANFLDTESFWCRSGFFSNLRWNVDSGIKFPQQMELLASRESDQHR